MIQAELLPTKEAPHRERNRKRFRAALQESIALKIQILESADLIEKVMEVVDLCVASLKKKGSLFFCGSGTSAAEADKLASKLAGRFYFDREAIRAEALQNSSSFVTALAIDFGYTEVFARALSSKGRQGDILFALSGSSSINDPSIRRAIEAASALNMPCVLISGLSDESFKVNPKYDIRVPSKDPARIQEAQAALGHIICELIESSLYSRPNA